MTNLSSGLSSGVERTGLKTRHDTKRPAGLKPGLYKREETQKEEKLRPIGCGPLGPSRRRWRDRGVTERGRGHAYRAIPRTGGCVVGSAEGCYGDEDDGVRRGGAAQQRRPTKRMSRREEEHREAKRDFIPQNTRDDAEVSLRRPTASQERYGRKKRRPAPFEMTGGAVGQNVGTSSDRRSHLGASDFNRKSTAANNVLGQRTCAAAISMRLRPVRLAV